MLSNSLWLQIPRLGAKLGMRESGVTDALAIRWKAVDL